jgi:hypothetical protein
MLEGVESKKAQTILKVGFPCSDRLCLWLQPCQYVLQSLQLS